MSSGGTLTIVLGIGAIAVFGFLWYSGKLCNISPSTFLCHKSGAQSFLDAGTPGLTPVEKTQQAGADLLVPGLVTTGPAAHFLAGK